MQKEQTTKKGENVGMGLGAVGGAVFGAKIGAGIGIASGGWAISATVPLGLIGGYFCGMLGKKVGMKVDTKRSQ